MKSIVFFRINNKLDNGLKIYNWFGTREQASLIHGYKQRCGSESRSVGSICFGPPGSGTVSGSVPLLMDPDPDPGGPKTYGSNGSGSFYHQAKIVRKTLTPTVL
jgi:hypothetical protein